MIQHDSRVGGLRTEEEIISSWGGDVFNPKVSIRCITYNHAPYIASAIRGFLGQITDFPFEVWIHDDASNDGTRQIIEEYERKYPRIIKTVLQDENQYSKGVKAGSFFRSRCAGDYYAVCEGDDFWTCPEKLSRQVKLLEENPECDMCIHSAVKLDCETGEEELIGRYRSLDGVVPAEEIIEKKFGQIPTASTLIRKTAYDNLESFFDSSPGPVVGDIYLHFFGSMRGGACYINRPMSCYRVNVPGSFADRYRSDGKLRLAHLVSRVDSYIFLDQETGGIFHGALTKSSRRFLNSFLRDHRNTRRARMDVYLAYFRLLRPKGMLVLFLKIWLPSVRRSFRSAGVLFQRGSRL